MGTGPPDATVDYTDGTDQDPDEYPTLRDKFQKAHRVLETAISEYDRPAILWTGGKDSTLTLALLMEVVDTDQTQLPPAVFIDHFQHFDETYEFVRRWTDRWNLSLLTVCNEDLQTYVDTQDIEPGDEIPVEALDDHNRHHIRKVLDYEEPTFPFLLDTYVGNHLLKTVPLDQTIKQHGFDAIITGVRWDEQAARSEETFFSPRHDADRYPPHDRVHPILPFRERDVWDALWLHVIPALVPAYPSNGHIPSGTEDLPAGMTPADIPISSKYWDGFRSLGSSVGTEKTADKPAWLQDIEQTEERAGRAQDKENLMERLRELGYM